MNLAPRPQSILPAAVSQWCVRAFAPAAIAGALIASSAPVGFMRLLGLAALVASAAGLLLHVHLLRQDHPGVWNEWSAALRSRIAGLRTRFGAALHAARSGLSLPAARGG